MTQTPDLELAFEGEAAARHTLDAETVAASLLGVQRALRMIASATTEAWEGDRRRYRPTKGVREAVVLHVGAPRAGSLVLPMTLEGQAPSSDLRRTFASLLGWVAGDDDQRPDLPGHVLDHLLASLLDWLPDRADLSVGLRLRGRQRHLLTSATRDRIAELLSVDRTETLRIIGEVTRAYLEEGQVRLRHPPSRRTFRVDVPAHVRARLSLTPGQWLVVDGRFRCDRHGDPVDLEALDRVDLADLSPVQVVEVPRRPSPLRARQPLTLAVTLDDETHQLFVVREPRLGLHAFVHDRAQLVEEVEEQLCFLWTTYACADQAQLAGDARALQANLRAAFFEFVP